MSTSAVSTATSAVTSAASSVFSSISRAATSSVSGSQTTRHSSTTTTSSGASATTSSSKHKGGATSNPLLFFVALGFGVVFTNLWIIVGVKYCFRYNRRNRAMRAAAANGEPIDMPTMQQPRRRRREKKLMTMEEVNERFPTLKYKTWRANREAEGLPTEGGINPEAAEVVAHSRAASLRNVEGVSNVQPAEETRKSSDLRSSAAQSHNKSSFLARLSHSRPTSSSGAGVVTVTDGNDSTTDTASDTNKSISEKKEKTSVVVTTAAPAVSSGSALTTTITEDDEDDEDPIRAATDDSAIAQAPGDTCAICLDNLDEDEDVRGLACGHAFHAVCVDPWLTSRRACCPLCKADYYIPKALPDGTVESTSSGRRGGPAGAYGWLGHRYMNGMYRPRIIVGSRGASDSAARSPGAHGDVPTRSWSTTAPVSLNPISYFSSPRSRTPRVNASSGPVLEGEDATVPQRQGRQAAPSWRTQLHNHRNRERRESAAASGFPSIPRFWRRGADDAGAANATAPASTTATPSQLESGIAARS